jgi:hypothetical protein
VKKALLVMTLCFLASCGLLAVPALQQIEWREYSYPDDGFAVSAPGKPVLQTQNTDTAVGMVEAHNYIVDLGNDSGLAINATNMKQAEGIDVRMVLEAAKKGIAEQTNGKITSEKDVSLNGNLGLEFELQNDAYHIRARYFFFKGRLLALLAMAPGKRPIPSEADRFFNSLRMLNP